MYFFAYFCYRRVFVEIQLEANADDILEVQNTLHRDTFFKTRQIK